MGDELKPCPFCGGNDISAISYPKSTAKRFVSMVICHNCGAGFSDIDSKEEAIKSWNNRITADDVSAEIIE